MTDQGLGKILRDPRTQIYNGVLITEVEPDTRPVHIIEAERRESNERSARAWREAVESLAQEKAEVIALLRGMANLETNETIERAVALIEEVFYD